MKVTAVGRQSKLRVDVDPSMGRSHWTFQVQQRRPDGSWRGLRTHRTAGRSEVRTLNLKRGTCRVEVHAGRGHQGTPSASVDLRR